MVPVVTDAVWLTSGTPPTDFFGSDSRGDGPPSSPGNNLYLRNMQRGSRFKGGFNDLRDLRVGTRQKRSAERLIEYKNRANTVSKSRKKCGSSLK